MWEIGGRQGGWLGTTRDSLIDQIQEQPLIIRQSLRKQKGKPRGLAKTRSQRMEKESEVSQGHKKGRETHWQPQVCVHFLLSPILKLHPCQPEQWPWWPGQEREMSTGPMEKGLVDCKLSIMAQIISILRRALCTMPGKSNTLKG